MKQIIIIVLSFLYVAYVSSNRLPGRFTTHLVTNVNENKQKHCLVAATTPEPRMQSQLSRIIKKLGPVLASSFCVAAIIYPLDLVRALQMANAGASLVFLIL